LVYGAKVKLLDHKHENIPHKLEGAS